MNRLRLPYLTITLAVCLLIGLSLASCSREIQHEQKLRPITYSDWTREISSYQPEILVVDAWATWCETCLERFPHMVELSQQYKNDGVQFVSLNLDDRNSAEDIELAQAFIEKMDANFPHYFMDENMMDAFDKLNFMSLPVVLIYDGQGKERFRLSGDNPNQQFTEEDVELSIQQLLKQQEA